MVTRARVPAASTSSVKERYEDWELMFAAVTARLREAVHTTPAWPTGLGAVVLECAQTLEQLREQLAALRADHEAVLAQLAQAGLTQTREAPSPPAEPPDPPRSDAPPADPQR